MLNPHANIARSKGIDLPILNVYLAGRISGNVIDKCLAWRKQIINHFKNYEWDEETQSYASYPLCIMDALNSKEADSIDEKGLTSNIPPNLIFQKDMLSVKKADVIVANMDDFLEVGIEDILNPPIINWFNGKIEWKKEPTIEQLKEAYLTLREKILNRRPNLGTIEEVAVGRYLGKVIILIVPESQEEIYTKHPFQGRAEIIVTSVEQLLKEKWIEILYKSIAGSTGNY